METYNKILHILNFKQKTNFFIQFILIILGTGLELISIGILMPILAILSQGEASFNASSFALVIHKTGITDSKDMLLFILGVLVVIYLVKMFFLSFAVWKQNKFIYEIQSDLSKKLYSGYLSQPYIFHIQRNSSSVINNVTLIVQQFSASLMAFLYILTEVLNLLGIIILLIIIEPIGTIMVFTVLGLSAWLFYSITKNRLIQWGQDLNFHEEMSIKQLQEGTGGLKELKLFGVEKEFGRKYTYHDKQRAQIRGNYNTIQAIPRFWLEFLAIVGIFMLISLLLFQGTSINDVLPKIGIFAAATFKLIPSFNKIISSIQNVQYTKQPLEVLSNELNAVQSIANNEDKPSLNFENKLELDVVSFQYPSSDRESIKNISLIIEKGQTIGFIGTTGAGKSTLVDIILGLLTPKHGTIKVDGSDIHSSIRSWQKQIGYVPQFIFLVDDSLRNNIAFGIPVTEINEDAIIRAVNLAQLDELMIELPEGLDTNVGERGVRLSGGQKQRVGIARALYHDPNVIVLDEATSSLDVETESSVMDSIRALHGTKTILIIAHRYSTIQHCDMIYKLDNGEVVQKGDLIELLN